MLFFPLPINVISEMLGVPQADRAQIRIWSNALAHGQGLGKQDESVKEHMRAFGEYTSQLVAEKRLHPADDLISQMVAIEEAGDRLSEEELLSMITLLIFAGHETTSNLIGTGTLMLLDHPDQLKKLKADPSLVPSAVEELLRFNGPATIVGPRFAMRDIEIAGQQIKMGDMLLVIPTSANRDEDPVFRSRRAGYCAQCQSSPRLWTWYPRLFGKAARPFGRRDCLCHSIQTHAQPEA